MKKILIMLYTAGITILAGCTDSNVEVIKTGTFNQYPQATIETAFKDVFEAAVWSSKEESGRTVVTFNGQISEKLHTRYISYAVDVFGLPKYKNKQADKFLSELKRSKSLSKSFLDSYKTALAAAGMQASYNLEEEAAKIENEVSKLRLQLKDLEKNYNKKEISYKKQLSKVKALEAKIRETQNKSREVDSEAYYLGTQAEKTDKVKAVHKQFFNKYLSETVWPVGSQVTFQWVVYPDGKRFELISFGNDSWQLLKMNLDTVLFTIYTL